MPTELLQTNAEQQAEDPIHLQANDQPSVKERPVIGLEIVKYTCFDPLTFLKDAS